MAAPLGTIVIGGGRGFVGQALVQAFRQAGANVVTVSRVPRSTSVGTRMTWEEVHKVGLPSDTRAVINVAGLNILQPLAYRQGAGFWAEVEASRVATTRSLAAAILRMPRPPAAFVVVSGVGYYPYSETATYDEESAGGTGNPMAELAAKWEAASVLPAGHPTRRTVIRSGVVIGSGGGIVQRIWLPFFLGLGGPIGWTGQQFFPFIALDDLVRMFMFAVEEDHVSGILNGVAPQVIRNQEFAVAMARAMWPWRPAILPLPDQVVRLVFGEVAADVMLKGMRVLPKRTQDLGYQFLLPDIRDTCKRAVGAA